MQGITSTSPGPSAHLCTVLTFWLSEKPKWIPTAPTSEGQAQDSLTRPSAGTCAGWLTSEPACLSICDHFCPFLATRTISSALLPFCRKQGCSLGRGGVSQSNACLAHNPSFCSSDHTTTLNAPTHPSVVVEIYLNLPGFQVWIPIFLYIAWSFHMLSA